MGPHAREIKLYLWQATVNSQTIVFITSFLHKRTASSCCNGKIELVTEDMVYFLFSRDPRSIETYYLPAADYMGHFQKFWSILERPEVIARGVGYLQKNKLMDGTAVTHMN